MKTRFLVLWAAAVFAASAAFVAHLSLRLETVRLGYDVGQARREQRRLIEQRRVLSVEAATLREPERVEAIARAAFHMDVPDASRIVSVGQRASRRSSGRMR